MPQGGSEPVEVPSWAWARDDMAAALAERRLGDVLRLAQKYSGASQSRLATATGLLQGRVSELIRGTRSATALDVFQRVADGLAMPDGARVTLGIAPRVSTTTASVAEIAAAYESQSAALDDIRQRSRVSPVVDVLAVRGLGLLGLSESVLRPVLAPGATLRVLLLDPECDAARRRADEIGEAYEGFAAGITLALTHLRDLGRTRPDLLVECRLYTTMPTWRVVAPEPAMFVSSFGASHEGHRSAMYRIERPGSLWWGFRRFLDEHHRNARRVI